MKIEKGIPAPKGKRGRKPLYPWTDLKIGESFIALNKTILNFRSMATRAGQAYGRKYKVREEKNGVRVWRVA
jgi:hypothetical protein